MKRGDSTEIIMKLLVIFLPLLITTVCSAKPATDCEITGDVTLWSYDSCYWQYETDDSIHPLVLACVKKNEKTISRLGTCKAKRVFKNRICGIIRDSGTTEPNPKTCMSKDQPLGSSVRDGGI